MAALVTRLLSHYWTADDHEAIRKAQVIDWLHDMMAFDVEVFAEACSRWRIKETHRPVIADIFKLCEEVAEMRQPAAVWTLPPPRDAGFPSKADRDYLRKKLRADKGGVGYSKLTVEEKWRWHSYDYAFRRLALSDDNSPIDPDRQWIDPAMIGEAEAIYRFGRSPSGRSRPA